MIDQAVVAPAAQGWLITCHGGHATRQLLTRHLEHSGGRQSSVENFWGQSEPLAAKALQDLGLIRGLTGAELLLACAHRGQQVIRQALQLPDEFFLARVAAWSQARFLYYLPRVQLWGPVNAGKSSLLNALCGRELARTGDTPGLTRDVIEGTLHHRGCELRLFDAPGVPQSAQELDNAAYQLAEQWRCEADLTLELVPPGHQPSGHPGHLVYFSRADENPQGRKPGISARQMATLDALKDRLVEHFLGRLMALPPGSRIALPKDVLDQLATGTRPRKILAEWA